VAYAIFPSNGGNYTVSVDAHNHFFLLLSLLTPKPFSFLRLFQGGHLVHGDLSEYNILVVPSYFVGAHAFGAANSRSDDLQAVLIDFGQAVDTRHPDTIPLLERDLDRVLSFFAQKGVDTPTLHEALALILE
jgi:RIO-like serine/threonine protein kinase